MDNLRSGNGLDGRLNDTLHRVADRGNSTAALPNDVYTDSRTMAAETRAVLCQAWMAVAFDADVPRPGTVFPIDVADTPLLAVRDRAGVVRIFHNVCRHRGMKLVVEPGRTGRVIRCPYHSWCYRLDGKLDRTPHVGGVGTDTHADIDPAMLGLMEVRSAVWFGTIFVDLSGQAPTFETAMSGLMGRWSAFDGATFHSGGDDSTFDMVLNANWKLAVENYLESYHLPSIHPALNSYSRIEDHELLVGDDGFAGQISVVYRPTLDADGRGFPRVGGLDESWQTRGEYVALYPNLLLGLHSDHWFTILLLPDGPERTQERIRLGYFSDDAANGVDHAALREANTRLWQVVFAEDIGPIERMQAGRHSPAFDGGILTPVLETTTRDFHAWLAGRLLNS